MHVIFVTLHICCHHGLLGSELRIIAGANFPWRECANYGHLRNRAGELSHYDILKLLFKRMLFEQTELKLHNE